MAGGVSTRTAGGAGRGARVRSLRMRVHVRRGQLLPGARRHLRSGDRAGVQLLVLNGVVPTPADTDWRGFYGHLYLWDPWFLLWWVLLGVTAFSLCEPPTCADLL